LKYFRRDEIDRSHYPVFHQVEAVRLLGKRSKK
jgi:phenylalanyl-tRNA synthetase alpha subunit